MARRTNAAIDAEKLREAAQLTEDYGLPPHIKNVLMVVADSVEAGNRKKAPAA